MLTARDRLYRRHRFPPEIISYAVWLYFRFPSADIHRLKALVQDRNMPQKHVWRAEIVLLTADGVGTNEIMRRTVKPKTCVWRWQERNPVAGGPDAAGDCGSVLPGYRRAEVGR